MQLIAQCNIWVIGNNDMTIDYYTTTEEEKVTPSYSKLRRLWWGGGVARK